MSRTSLLTIVLVAAWPLVAQSAGQEGSPKNLGEMDIEDLMNIQITSVSKKAQRVKAVAAAVFVITSEDIRRSGLHSLPEILRLAPGVQVAQIDSGSWAISIRGFNDEFSNKLLVLVDGRSIYDELFGGIFWDLQETLIDTIERIEVIRGPGAAIWGTNAVNGVVNIITKSSEATQGAMIEAGGGSQTEVNTGMRYGGKIGSNATYRVVAHYGNQGSFALNDPLVTSRGWANQKLGFRMDWKPTPQDTLMFSGSGYVSDRGHTVQTPSPQNPFPPVFDIRENFNTADAEGRWQHVFSDNSSIETRVSWTHTHREDYYDPSASNKVDFDFQHHVAFGRNDLIWGVNVRNATYTMLPGGAPTYRVIPTDSSVDAYAGFFEDEFALMQDKLYFVAGMQVSHNQFTGIEVQPTGRLIWTPAKKLSSWAAVSRAVRTPTILERGFDALAKAFPAQPPLFGLVELIGSPKFRSEPMTSYELGQRIEIGNRVSLDASAFMSFYQRLETGVSPPIEFVPPSAAGPAHLLSKILYTNSRYGQAEGVELSAIWTASKRWKWMGGYSWLRIHSHAYPGEIDQKLAYAEADSPENQFQVRSYFDVSRTVQLDAAIYCYGGIIGNSLAGVPPTPLHLRGDLRLGWRPNTKLEFSGGVQNAFDPNHLEFGSPRVLAGSEVPRNVYASLKFYF